MKKRIVILGSTGSVGVNVLDVVDHHPDLFDVVGLSARKNVDEMAKQTATHPHAKVMMENEAAAAKLAVADPSLNGRIVGAGEQALVDLIDASEPDLVVNCLVGFVGLKPTLHALHNGVPVALANKESVVTGGELLNKASHASGAALIPIDSEHVAVSQCLRGQPMDEVKKVYITASGGALRDHPLDQMADVTPETVLAHPTWDMGAKITVDCATMVNKGLEVIEAHWLFDLPYEQIGVVVHPQSIVHALVEFHDNAIIAQMAVPDMRLPILYALTYPDRIETPISPSRITDFPHLSFAEVDEKRYPCFSLVLRAAQEGGVATTILNSANEVAVGSFLAGKLVFSHIYGIIESALDHVPRRKIDSYADVLETDRATRAYVREKHGL